ncbi:hypothetical protein C2E23DRAFT_251926 [Lenzites betulinus]|nr:hypothetical protein C2E23DRAFT_251926 [Lenzites betulinus]
MLSPRERRFFAIAANLDGLRVRSGSSSMNELRDDALEDWRESDTMESRRAGARMYSISSAGLLRHINGGEIGVISGRLGDPGDCGPIASACGTSVVTALCKVLSEFMRMAGTPLFLRRGASTGFAGTMGAMGAMVVLIVSNEGLGVCDGVLNALDFVRAKSARVVVFDPRLVTLVRAPVPASSLLSSNETPALGPIQVASLSRRFGLGIASTNAVVLRLLLRRRRKTKTSTRRTKMIVTPPLTEDAMMIVLVWLSLDAGEVPNREAQYFKGLCQSYLWPPKLGGELSVVLSPEVPVSGRALALEVGLTVGEGCAALAKMNGTGLHRRSISCHSRFYTVTHSDVVGVAGGTGLFDPSSGTDPSGEPVLDPSGGTLCVVVPELGSVVAPAFGSG